MYNGRVTVGGPAAVHELGGLVLSKLAVGPFDNNCYLLRCRETGAQVLVDAAAEADRIMDLVGPEGVSLIITTHGHPDHWQALYNKVVVYQFDLHEHDQAAASLARLKELKQQNPAIPDLSAIEREVNGG